MVEAVLTDKERDAYYKYMASGKPPLAPSTSAGMYALFLQGTTLQEIADLNPGFGLGIICRARIDNEWDKKRTEHTTHLIEDIRQIVQTTQLEAVQFVAEGMAAYRKLAGEKFKRYLQSGKPEDLGEFNSMSLKNYKELLELLLKLTGQETGKKISGVVEHHHTLETTPVTEMPKGNRPMSAEEATIFLERLDKPKEKK